MTAQSIPEELRVAALEWISEVHGIAIDELEIAGATIAKYPLLEKRGFAFKILNRQEPEIHSILLDEESREMDPVQLESDEQEARHSRYGKLGSALADHLDTIPDEEPVEVCIWVKQPPFEGPDRPRPDSDIQPEDIDALYDEVLEYGRAFTEELVTPVKEKITAFTEEAEANELIPVIYATLKRETIREIGEWEEVDEIYLAHEYAPCLANTRATIGADVLQKRGITGGFRNNLNNIRVAIVESSKGTLAQNNPYFELSRMTWDKDMSMAISLHTTAVAGVLVSQDRTHPGISPGVDLYVASPPKPIEPKLCASTNRAIAWKAAVINYSFAAQSSRKMNSFDRYVDEMAAKYWRTFVIGSGNVENRGDPAFVGSPAKGYNIITVGAININRTSFPWKDDTMWEFSCYVDPISRHDDREKPEVVAPGFLVETLNVQQPWNDFLASGTSYSAPVVAGAAALLISEKRILAAWPEAVKAILMVSAAHDVEKQSNAKDGAGMIDSHYANSLIHRKDPFSLGGGKGDFGVGDFDRDARNLPRRQILTNMDLVAGKKARAAFVWTQNPSYSGYKDQPSVDFDLLIIGPTGKLVAVSASWDCNFEWVEFTPAASGRHQLKIQQIWARKSPPWYSWAWWQKN